MRKFINIVEAPIQDYEQIGDKNIAGTLERSDLKVISNPQWKTKLLHSFRNVPEPINIYVANYNTDQYVDVKDRDTSIRPMTDIDHQSFRPWTQLISGQYSANGFEKQFGFLPPNVNESITVLLTHNFGDGKIPLTPWMIIHRMIHAFNFRNDIVRVNNADVRHMDDAAQQIFKIIDMCQYYSKLGHTALGKVVSTLRSARSGIERKGELVIELISQYFIKGRFDFDVRKLNLDNDEHTAELLIEIEIAHKKLDVWRRELKGRIFVL